MTTVWAILLAGGSGQRFGKHTSKLLEPLGNHNVFYHSANAMTTIPNLAGMIVVSHPQWQDTYQTHLPETLTCPLHWVEGGRTRRHSVWNGLCHLPENVEVVVIHDAARPLVQPSHIADVLSPVLQQEVKGASLGIPATNTIKQVHPETNTVASTLDRSTLWAVQTPQAFDVQTLKQAHQHLSQELPITDDAELVERYMAPMSSVIMIPSSPDNIKITTPTDLIVAQALLANTLALAH